MVSVKNFHLEAPYLSAIVDNPTDIFIANLYPYTSSLQYNLASSSVQAEKP